MGRVLLAGILSVLIIFCAAGCGTATQDTSLGNESSTSTVTDADGPSTTKGASVSFVAPIGEGDGRITYVDTPEGKWGPASFCVLPDGSVAILDGGGLSIEVFAPTGEPQYTLDLTGIVYSPSDIRWWNDCFAVLAMETGSSTSVWLIDTEGNLKQTIPLVDELSGVVLYGPLRVSGNGELMALVGNDLYAIADGQGSVLSDDEMSTAKTTSSLLGNPELEIGSDDGVSTWVTVSGSGTWLTIEPGTSFYPWGSDDAGDTYLGGRRLGYDAAGAVDKSDYLIVRIGESLAEVDFALVDEDSKLSGMGNRLIDVVDDGTVYSMVPEVDGVHIETLEFSSTYPEL